MAELGEATVAIRANFDKFDNDVKGARGKIGKALGGIATGATAAIGVALAGAGVAVTKFTSDSIKEFTSFQQGMNEVFTLLPGLTQDAMDSMSQDALDFAKNMGVLPEEVIPALYQAISAGVPKENVFDFLATAQKAAVGGVTGLETSVDGITSVVNAYGEDVISATEASDLMFTAVKQGKTDFDQLSKSLFNVIPTASSLGVEFGDVTAALAAMTAQGTPTSVATTQLRQLLIELSKDGGKMAKKFKEISGTTFKDFISQGNSLQDALSLIDGELQNLSGDVSLSVGDDLQEMIDVTNNDFPGAIDQFKNLVAAGEDFDTIKKDWADESWGWLKEYYDILTQSEGAAGGASKSISDLFSSVEAGNAALALTGSGTDAFTDNMAQMEDSAGATAAAYETMNGGIGRAQERAAALMSTIKIGVGSALEPLLNKLVELGEQALPFIEEVMAEATPVIEEFAAEFGEKLGPALEIILGNLRRIADAIGLTNDEMTDAETVAALLGSAFDLLITTLEALAVISEGMAYIWEEWGPALKRILNPLGMLLKDVGELDQKLQDLAGSLPDWLTPGSPTPFELGIKGINSALNKLPDLSSKFEMTPSFGGISDGDGVDRSTNVNVNADATINNGSPIDDALTMAFSALRVEVKQKMAGA